MLLKEIINYFNSIYPFSLKASYDNVGLMVGRGEKEVKKVLICLDCTKKVVSQAIDGKYDLIISHHPFIFSPLYSIDLEKDSGSIIKSLIENDISLLSLHTNFDSAKMNDFLSSLIGIKNKNVLSIKENIGVYGDVIEMPLKEYISLIKDAFKIDSCDYYGVDDIIIKKVAITGGSGSSLMDECLNKDIDLYITGDVTYSRGLEAIRKGINILDVGHHVENLFYKVIINDLENLDSSIIKEKAIEEFPIYKRY